MLGLMSQQQVQPEGQRSCMAEVMSDNSSSSSGQQLRPHARLA